MQHSIHGFAIGIASDDDIPFGISITPNHGQAMIVLDPEQAIDHATSVLLAAQTVRSMRETSDAR